MYTDVSNDFKNIVKGNVITSAARLTFKDYYAEVAEKNLLPYGLSNYVIPSWFINDWNETSNQDFIKNTNGKKGYQAITPNTLLRIDLSNLESGTYCLSFKYKRLFHKMAFVTEAICKSAEGRGFLYKYGDYTYEFSPSHILEPNIQEVEDLSWHTYSLKFELNEPEFEYDGLTGRITFMIEEVPGESETETINPDEPVFYIADVTLSKGEEPIEYRERDLVITKENLTDNAVTISDFCCNNGQLIGTAMMKQAEIEIENKENYDLENKNFDLEIGVLNDRTNSVYEYLPYGNYTVESYEDLKSSKKYRLIANDLMHKLNGEFKDNTDFNPTFPISLKDFYEEFMASYGIEVEEQTLPNEDFEIAEMPNLDGYTGRQVLMRLAELFGSFAKINRSNKCQMYLKTPTNEIIYANQMNSKLEIDKQYGPVNVVSVGMSNVEGENVTLRDEESIETNGEITIRIDDNPFVYSEELRELVIGDLYDRLRGLTYTPVNFKMKALMYLDCGDAVRVENVQNGMLSETIILNQTIKVPRTRETQIDNKALTDIGQKYQYISKSKQAQSQTEIKVDKQKGEISAINSRIEGDESRITTVESDVHGLQTTVVYQNEFQTTINKLQDDIRGITNTWSESGGNNLVYYDKEFWTGTEIEVPITRTVRVGDDLSGKTLLLNFPEGVDLEIEQGSPVNIIEGNTSYSISLSDYDASGNRIKAIAILEDQSGTVLYLYNATDEELQINLTEVTLSDNFGEVTTIDDTKLPFNYIKINDTEIEYQVNLEEYTNTEIKSNSIADRGYRLNNGHSEQLIQVVNGTYTISCKYIKLKPLATGTIKINGVSYELTSSYWTKFEQTINVDTQQILIEFDCDSDEAFYITDLLVNSGDKADVWTQNPNETRTETVKIGKGIEVRSSTTDTMLKADSDGVRIVQASNESNTVAEFTDKGTETKNIIVEDTAELAGLLFQKAKYESSPYSPILPDEYQEVEYLESTGTQYIDANFYATGTTTFDIDFMYLSNVSDGYKMVFGTRSSGSTKQLLLSVATPAGTISGDYGSSAGIFAFDTTTTVLNTKINVKTTFDSTSYNMYINNGTKNAISLQSFTAEQTMTLFAINNVGTIEPRNAPFRIYQCKFSENGSLIRNFVPCYRKQDDVAGMYDLVNDVFYTNSGTGNFVVGDDVNVATNGYLSEASDRYTQTWISSLL